MFETVSVDDALSRGKRTVLFASVGIFVLVNVVYVALIVAFPKLVAWIAIIGLLISFAGAWLYWSFAITKWRLWAFENVRNVHELKKRAIKEGLIWKDGGFLEKTEMRSAEEKMRWEELQSKFKVEDIFHDDYSIPVETQLRFSKNVAIFLMILGLILAGVGVAFFAFSAEKGWIGGAITGVGGLGLLIFGYRRYNNRNPQIILNNDGVSTAKIQFYSWADVANEDTKVVQHGKSSTTYFIYNCPQGEVRVNMGELDISKRKLEKLLRIYRGRFEQKNKHSSIQ